MTSDDTLFATGRGREILAALKANRPEEALRLARHMVAEGGAEPGPRRAEALVAAAAMIAQLDASAATDPALRHQADYRAMLADICTPQELTDAALALMVQQGSARGSLPPALYDHLAAAARTSPFLTEKLRDIRRGT